MATAGWFRRAAAGWLRSATAGWLRSATASSLPRPPAPAFLTETESFVGRGLGTAARPAMKSMAVPKVTRFGTKDLNRGTLVNLKDMERMISASEKIAQVATISDYLGMEFGELIAKSMKKVGDDWVITIVDGKTLHNYFEVVEGMKLYKCYIPPYLMAIQKNLKCVTISNGNTIILPGAGDKKAIEDRLDKIYGPSELRLGEKNDRVTTAQNSTKAGVKDIVPDTACATYLTKAIFTTKSCKPFAAGTNATNLRRGISICCPMPRARGYSTSVQNEHPHLVTFESASNYFERGPELKVHVPDLTSDLYRLVKYNADRPILLTEPGKVVSRSLVESVLNLHEHNLCLKQKLDLDSLLVSSIGTFKLPNMETIPLTEQNRLDDLANVSTVLEDMMILAHGKRAMQHLPPDYSDLLKDLRDPNAIPEVIRYHPAHLPATTYALAFMKLHGLIMKQGLARIDYLAAYSIVDILPYQDGPEVWTDTARKDRLLKKWLNHRYYTSANPFHIMEFGRNVMGGHPLEQRATAARFLPYGSPPYTEAAVNILFQHSYPKLLPHLLGLVVTYFKQWNPEWIRNLGFEDLFPGVPPYYLHKE